MSNYEFVSIVLTAYNAEATLLQTLNSIKNQTYKDFELIFIDDGSKDGSLKIAEDFFKKKEINMKIIHRENKGFLYSLIEGIYNSNGNYIARIDADDIWEYNHLYLILKEFKKNGSLVLCGSNAIFVNNVNKIVGKTNLPLKDSEIRKYMLRDNPFIHSSVVFKKEVYNKTCGYLINEECAKLISDYNLFFELSKKGQCMNIAEYTVLYRILDNSMSRNIDKCINYNARLKIMKKVFMFYKKKFLYYFINSFKVKIKIFYHCTVKKLNLILI